MENAAKSTPIKVKYPLKNDFYQAKNAIHKATSVMFPFLIFGAVFEMVLGWLSGVLPGSFIYYIIFFSLQFFYVGFVTFLVFKVAGPDGVPAGATIAAYFAFFYEGGIAGSGNLGYLGYMVMGVMLAFSIKYLNMLWLKILPPLEKALARFLGAIFKIGTKNKPEQKEKRQDAANGLIYELRKLGDWLIRMLILPCLTTIVIALIFHFGVAGPLAKLGTYLADIVVGYSPSQIVTAGIVIGIIVAIDLTGPLSMATFAAIFATLGTGSAHAAQLMTIFAACITVPTWICILLFVLQTLTKRKWPLDFDDENFAMTGIINMLFNNTRLVTVSPMMLALRDPFVMVPGFIVGCGTTGAITALMGTTNSYYIGEYLSLYGANGSEKIFTPGYDALVRLQDVLYSGSSIWALLGAVIAGGLAGALFVFLLRLLRNGVLTKKGKDIYALYGSRMLPGYSAPLYGNTTYSEAGWELTPVQGPQFGPASVGREVDDKYLLRWETQKLNPDAEEDEARLAEQTQAVEEEKLAYLAQIDEKDQKIKGLEAELARLKKSKPTAGKDASYAAHQAGFPQNPSAKQGTAALREYPAGLSTMISVPPRSYGIEKNDAKKKEE